jgi:hypothetical protein
MTRTASAEPLEEGKPDSKSMVEILILPHKNLKTTLRQDITPKVKSQLSTIDPGNVEKQREYIHHVLQAVEEKLVHGSEPNLSESLRDLRDIALEAFVRSFEVAPARGSELVKFCQDYLPDASEKKPKLKSKALIAAIKNLSAKGLHNVQKTLDSANVLPPSDKKSAARITMYLPKGGEALPVGKAIQIARLNSLDTKVDYTALWKRFSAASKPDKNEIITQLARRLKALDGSRKPSGREKSLALNAITRMIVQELNAGRGTEDKIRQLALIIDQVAAHKSSSLSKVALEQIKNLNSRSYEGVLQMFEFSTTTNFSDKHRKLFVEALPKLLPDKFTPPQP